MSTLPTARSHPSGSDAAPRPFGLDDLWMAYACGGGQLLLLELAEVLRGTRRLGGPERRILTAALAELTRPAGASDAGRRAG